MSDSSGPNCGHPYAGLDKNVRDRLRCQLHPCHVGSHQAVITVEWPDPEPPAEWSWTDDPAERGKPGKLWAGPMGSAVAPDRRSRPGRPRRAG